MSNAGNFTVGLAEVVKYWSDAAYSVGRLLVLLAIFFGLLYYLGKLLKEPYKLKKPSRFEIDPKNFAWGLGFLIILLTMVVMITPSVKRETAQIPVFIGFLGVVEWVLLFVTSFVYVRTYPKGPIQTNKGLLRESIVFGFSFGLFFLFMFFLLVFIIPILAIIFPNQQQLLLYLGILIVLVANPFLIGALTRLSEPEVSVYLSDSSEPLENLILYQTTDVDYRFKKRNEEIMIPISQVQKIVYKTPPKEDLKAVSSDRTRNEVTREGG